MSPYVKVAEASAVPPGSVVQAQVGDLTLAVANVDGEYFALDGTCTHVRGPLAEGDLEGAALTCPWHGGRFDVRTGQVLRPPPRMSTRTFPVTIDGGALLVEVPDV